MYAHSCLIDEQSMPTKGSSITHGVSFEWVERLTPKKKNAAGVVCDCVFLHVSVGRFVWANKNHDTMAEINYFPN